MGVVVETAVWEPNPVAFVFLFVACSCFIFFLPYSSRNASAPSSVFEGAASSVTFRRFQRGFLLIYSLASVMEGLSSVYGELELSILGLNKEQMVSTLCVGILASLVVGTSFGVLSDALGQKKFCLIFFFLHLFVGVLRKVSGHRSLWLSSTCLSLSSSIFSFSFEAWVVLEHEKQGHREELLNDIFWLMTFLGSACFIATQDLANLLIGAEVRENLSHTSITASWLAVLGVACIARGWRKPSQTIGFRDYDKSYAHLFKDKRVVLLTFTQASVQFSGAVFGILWSPTLVVCSCSINTGRHHIHFFGVTLAPIFILSLLLYVADGREVRLGLIYPCMMGARMLGSTIFPWLTSASMSVRMEECLVYAFIISGFVFSVVAYDYQEVGFLLTLFCVYHACVGTILPSLARLRTMYVPHHLRAGMISSSLALSNAALLFFVVQRGYYQSIGNSTMMTFAAVGLLAAAGCMHVLKRLGKQPYENGDKS